MGLFGTGLETHYLLDVSLFIKLLVLLLFYLLNYIVRTKLFQTMASVLI
jgi:hypothetical protein